MATVRSYIFIDQLQPKTMCYLGTFIRGFLPRSNMAALVVEVSPGLEIETVADVAVKTVDVKPGMLVVERQFGYLEFHSQFDGVGEGGRRGDPRSSRCIRCRCDEAGNPRRRASSSASTIITPF